MRCPSCQTDNPAGASFCGECGTRLAAVCPSCGTANTASNKFCHNCGTRLIAAAPAAPAPPPPAAPAPATPAPSERFADPHSYTPRHLAEKILTSKAAIAGERKQVTVLFTDVSGFTAMSERLDPEEVHGIMDRMFEVILGAVHRFEGTVNQFLGDGCMALFGAPIAHEDHAHRAIRAALAIQHGLDPLRADVARVHGLDLRVRVGINTGPVVVGAIGRDLRMDYTAVGDTTNLAARLLNVAQPGQIVVSDHTRLLTEGYFVFDDLGEFSLKGKSAPVHAAAALSERRGRTRLEVSRERGLTPLSGRAAERARLTEAFERACEGEGAVVWVSGEPGVGKSRLLYEFTRPLAEAGVLEVEANCPSYGRSIPYYPLLTIVRALLQIDETTPAPEAEERIGALLQRLGIEDDEAEALLAHFVGLAVTSPFLVRLQGAELKQRTFRLLKALIVNESDRRPCVVVLVENLHWADDSSLEFLRQLAAAVRDRRVMLILSTRPDFVPAWRDELCTDTLHIGGLGRPDVERMIGTLVDAYAVAPELVDMLLDRSGGNPLYLEEIVRQLQETQALSVADGTARLETGGIAVPETIHDIIAARIDRLQESLKETLQPAAVVGRQFPVPLVSRVLQAEADIAPRLTTLHQLDFVFPSAREPEPAYTFKHALTQEVVYTGLLERRRRAYHAEIAQALEEIHAERLDEVLEVLAYHYGRSGDDARAVDYAIRAGEKAQKRWANSEALTHFESALSRLETMPDTEANRLRRIDAVVKQCEIRFALGQHAAHLKAMEAIGEIVKSADVPRRAAWLSWTGFLHSLTGSSPAVSIAYCSEAAELARAEGLEDMWAFAECSLAHVSLAAGDLRAAREAAEWALGVFEARGNLWWACRTLWALLPTLNALGEWDLALEYGDRALAHATRADDARLKVVAFVRRGTTEVLRGNPAAGLEAFRQAAELKPGPFDMMMLKVNRAGALLKSGDVETGMADLAEAVAWFKESRLHYTHAVFGLRLVEAHLRAGAREDARALAEEILATSQARGYVHAEASAERLLGEYFVDVDPRVAAEHFERATKTFEAIGARNDLAKAWTGQARRCEAAGDHEGATALLQRALALFEELGTLDEIARTRAALERG